MKTLLVAPLNDLDYIEKEVRAVRDALDPVLLTGSNATSEELMDALTKQDFDMVWFAAHGTDGGIELSDGFIDSLTLAQFLRSTSAAVFLNTCRSLSLAMDIHDESGCQVICTIADVPDIEAYRTGAFLARFLARGMSLREAYEKAKPGRNRKFVFINSMINGNIDQFDELIIAIRRTSRELSEKMIDLNGDTLRRINAIELHIDKMKADLNENYQQKPTREDVGKWTAGFTIFVVCMALFYSDVRHALGISAIPAFIIALIGFPLSAHLIATSLGLSIDAIERKGRK